MGAYDIYALIDKDSNNVLYPDLFVNSTLYNHLRLNPGWLLKCKMLGAMPAHLLR